MRVCMYVSYDGRAVQVSSLLLKAITQRSFDSLIFCFAYIALASADQCFPDGGISVCITSNLIREVNKFI